MIVPLATLHHFVHPQWFEDLGGFEKEANIAHYLTWVELAYRWLWIRPLPICRLLTCMRPPPIAIKCQTA